MKPQISIGTRVHASLYSRGFGTVFAIHGNQAPETVRQIGGIMGTGGRADFDIVFDCGSLSKRLPECILRGPQWRVLDETVDAATMNAAIEFAECEQLRRTSEEASAKLEFEREIDRLRADPSLTSLIQGNDRSSGKLAAKNIRTQLKAAFRSATFSVRVRHTGSIDVKWTDGPTVAQVKTIASAYEAGRFDGMNDIYENRSTPWTHVFGGSDYVFMARAPSDTLLETTIATMFERYAGNFAGSGITATAADYRAGRLFNVAIPGLGCSLEQEIRTIAADTAS